MLFILGLSSESAAEFNYAFSLTAPENLRGSREVPYGGIKRSGRGKKRFSGD
jgi:hypothetical protein